MPDKSISLSDLNDDPSLVDELDEKEVNELLADFDAEGGLAGNVAQALTARQRQHASDATKADEDEDKDEKPAAKATPAPAKKDN